MGIGSMDQPTLVANRLITEKEVAYLQGKSVKGVRKDRYNGTGPKWVRLGRLVRYRLSDVEAFIGSLSPGSEKHGAERTGQVG